MAIPNFQQCMRPFLAALADGEVHHFNDGYGNVIKEFSVREEEQRELLPFGKQGVV